MRSPGGSGLVGVKTIWLVFAVLLFVTVMVPGTSNCPAVVVAKTANDSWPLASVTVAGSICWLTLMVMVVFTDTLPVPALGTVVVTEGPVVMLAVPVVNELLNVVTALPERSVKPVTWTLKGVEAGRVPVGVKVR